MKASNLMIFGVLLVCLLLIIRCTDDHISVVKVTINGAESNVRLSQSFTLPINKTVASLIQNESSCYCYNELELIGDFYVTSCCEMFPSCNLKINKFTGDTYCELFG
jgi:hypothetical protein